MKNILHQPQIKKGSFLKFKQSGSIRTGRRGHASVPWWDPIFSSILPLPFLSSWWKKYFGCLPEALLFWDIAPALAWICVLWVSRWEVSWISTSASVLPRGVLDALFANYADCNLKSFCLILRFTTILTCLLLGLFTSVRVDQLMVRMLSRLNFAFFPIWKSHAEALVTSLLS